ncbi:3'(2'),5'-bisphosphate nucleotidase CysQ family protein [Ochrovirga pacifica]|uniref:3'(2'),5'-bisphosphate nucleotidase CysQ family protein n=1 Tax=Ochrovirga pacifica TaxID=1042376 RepID=UPI000255A529|nr:inositol monophosphatase family protein [Ochrovirga pacifica]
MKLQKSHLLELQEIAQQAALNAGKYIQSKLNEDYEIGSKGTNSKASDIVTEVDINAQKIIAKALQESIQKYDLGWLGEETPDDGSRLVKDYFFTVDPIDGTLPFTKKTNGFSVSIGLVSQSGISVLGVAYDPYHDVLYCAVKGEKAYRNGEEFKINYNKNKGLTFYSDLSFVSSGAYPFLIESLERTAKEKYGGALKVVDHQGAVINAMSVIENAPAVYIKPHRDKQGGGCAWDFAASACIAEAVGIKVTDYFGNPINLNKKENTYMNNEGIRFEVW